MSFVSPVPTLYFNVFQRNFRTTYMLSSDDDVEQKYNDFINSLISLVCCTVSEVL